MDKIKVLFVTNHFRFSNGVASVLRAMIDNLDQDKFDIHLLAIYDFNEEFANPIMDKITVVKGFNFYFRGFDKIMEYIPLKWLYKFFVKEKYDLEVAYQFGMPTRIISASPNSNKVCWMHGYDINHMLWENYKKFNEIINVSQSGMQRLISDGMDASKCDYCYNVVDENVIVEKTNEPIDIERTHSVVFIMVGRLSVEKGGLRLLKCIESAGNVDAEFWIVGGGLQEEDMRQYIKEHNLSDRVKMTGAQKNPYKYMVKADIYLCCSFHEGFSTTCQEAALLGLPVVSTDVSGSKELIETAGCGMVFTNDEQGLIQGILTVCNDSNLLKMWKEVAYLNKKQFYKENRIKRIESTLIRNCKSH